MKQVGMAPCPDYDPTNCRQALERALSPIGGLEWVKAGMTVAIKVNLVSAMKPEAAATTHPVLLRQLAELLREKGAQVVIGDSPGGLYNAPALNRVYAVTGMHEAEKAGARLNRNFSQREASYPEAMVAKSFQVTAWLDEADAIIDFCKLKSHGMMGMSGAAKNMFGSIPGTMKPEYHFRYPDPRDFARMLIDLDEYWKPVLSIADAVIGMEGNGPTAGKPRYIGAVLASKSPHELDLVCAKLIGLKREDVPTLEAAYERGLIPATAEELELAGEIESMVVPDFENLETRNSLLFKNLFRGRLGELAGSVVQRCLRTRPQVHRRECIGCGKCGGICPAGAITMKNKLPHIDKSRCIRCFCCQEFCPKGAMKAGRTGIAKLLNR